MRSSAEGPVRPRQTMSNDQQPTSPSSPAELSAFLAQVRATPVATTNRRRGRLIFGLDATASREDTWEEARRIQGDMFQIAASLGGLDIQLCHYRGLAEFVASDWVVDAGELRRQMARVACLAGETRILQVLEHAILESRKQKVNALVFVGDCMEESMDRLCQRAGELGLLGVKAFMFLEGDHPGAERCFRQIAKVTGGAFCRFDPASPGQLRELLTAVAAYAAGGRLALEQFGAGRSSLTQQLTRQVTP